MQSDLTHLNYCRFVQLSYTPFIRGELLTIKSREVSLFSVKINHA